MGGNTTVEIELGSERGLCKYISRQAGRDNNKKQVLE